MNEHMLVITKIKFMYKLYIFVKRAGCLVILLLKNENFLVEMLSLVQPVWAQYLIVRRGVNSGVVSHRSCTSIHKQLYWYS